jgi:hypothetical protein
MQTYFLNKKSNHKEVDFPLRIILFFLKLRPLFFCCCEGLIITKFAIFCPNLKLINLLWFRRNLNYFVLKFPPKPDFIHKKQSCCSAFLESQSSGLVPNSKNYQRRSKLRRNTQILVLKYYFNLNS